MDGEDITGVRFSSIYNNLLIDCSEDALMGIYNLESTEEDDFTILNIEDSCLATGFLGFHTYCITMNKYIQYQPNVDNNDIAPEQSAKLELSMLKLSNPHADYIVSAFLRQDMQENLLIGSHQ